MLFTATAERLVDVDDEAVDLMYRAIEHRLSELLHRSRSALQRLAPALPSVHVAVPLPEHVVGLDDATKGSLDYYAVAAHVAPLTNPLRKHATTSNALSTTTTATTSTTATITAAVAAADADSYVDASISFGATDSDAATSTSTSTTSAIMRAAPTRSAARIRGHGALRCAGVIASHDVVRALRLRVPLIAEDWNVVVERTALSVAAWN